MADQGYYNNNQANYYGEYGPRQLDDEQQADFGQGQSGGWDDRDRESYTQSRDNRDRRRERRRHRRRSRDRSRSRSRSRSRERRRRDRHRSRSRSRDPSDNRGERQKSYSDKGEYRDRDRSTRPQDQGDRHRDGYSDEDGRPIQQGDQHNSKRTSGNDWRSKLTSIRDAHFNRNKQASLAAQNTFKNDGSFLEMFKKKMAGQGEDASSSVTPNSLVLASSSIPYSDGLSLPPLTATPIQEPQSSSSSAVDDQDVDGIPMATHKPLPMPVSIGKRRLAKPLKTGIVFKKPPEPAEDEASQEKLDAWSRYLQEVQKYKSANCMDEDVSRPLVK